MSGLPITHFKMPIVNGYPQLNSYPTEFILNQVLAQGTPTEGNYLLTSEERQEYRRLKRDILTDPSHIFGIEAQKTQLGKWTMTSYLHSDLCPDLPEMTTENFTERQIISLLVMYEENCLACQHFYERDTDVVPNVDLKRKLQITQNLGYLPYVLRTRRLMLPPIIGSTEDDKVERQLKDHFAPIEETY